jgi:hypothetical protein
MSYFFNDSSEVFKNTDLKEILKEIRTLYNVFKLDDWGSAGAITGEKARITFRFSSEKLNLPCVDFIVHVLYVRPSEESGVVTKMMSNSIERFNQENSVVPEVSRYYDELKDLVCNISNLASFDECNDPQHYAFHHYDPCFEKECDIEEKEPHKTQKLKKLVPPSPIG